MNRFLKIGIVVRFAAMPFVLLSNSVDFHYRWTLSSGILEASRKKFTSCGVSGLVLIPQKSPPYVTMTVLPLYTWFYFNCYNTVVIDCNALFLFNVHFLSYINKNLI